MGGSLGGLAAWYLIDEVPDPRSRVESGVVLALGLAVIGLGLLAYRAIGSVEPAAVVLFAVVFLVLFAVPWTVGRLDHGALGSEP